MKFPKENTNSLVVIGGVQIVLFVIGIVTHDWFWFIAVYVLNSNTRNVINYNGIED